MRLTDEQGGDDAPGTVLALAPGPLVRTGDGAIALVDADPPDALRVGDVLGVDP